MDATIAAGELDHAFEVATAMPVGYSYDSSLRKIAQAIYLATRDDGPSMAADRVPNSDLQLGVVQWIFRRMLPVSANGEADVLISALRSPRKRWQAIAWVVKGFLEALEVDRTAITASGITNPRRRCQMLVDMTCAYVDNTQVDAAAVLGSVIRTAFDSKLDAEEIAAFQRSVRHSLQGKQPLSSEDDLLCS